MRFSFVHPSEHALRVDMCCCRTPLRFQTLPTVCVLGIVQVDRFRVLEDLFESEAWFQETKRKVIDVYMEAYEHCTHPGKLRDLAQTVCLLDGVVSFRQCILFRSAFSLFLSYNHGSLVIGT